MLLVEGILCTADSGNRCGLSSATLSHRQYLAQAEESNPNNTKSIKFMIT
ncbi:MAG: hypothetical protein ACI93H_001118 [Psychromonas sp.]|jgi:hypothetical protein